MPLYLDHTIIPAKDKEASARFFARILGLEHKGPWGPFAPVKVNDTLTMDFGDAGDRIEILHFAFLAEDYDFDAILARVQEEKLSYGSGPRSLDDMQINHLHGGRGFYFRDLDGHVLEVLTHTYV